MLQQKKRKIDISFKDNRPVINIFLDFDCNLDEYTSPESVNEITVQKELEEKISTAIAQDCNELIKYLQSIGSDPLGFGEMIRVKHNKYWKSVNWKDVYKDIEIHAEADLNIIRYGAIH